MKTSESEIKLIKTKLFMKKLPFDIYSNGEELLMSRRQIGIALGYPNPTKAIEKIHTRHADRLDKFCFVQRIQTTEGLRLVTRDVTLYTQRGVFEVYRWSDQSQAHEFMDFIWDEIKNFQIGKKQVVSNDMVIPPEIIQHTIDSFIGNRTGNMRLDNTIITIMRAALNQRIDLELPEDLLQEMQLTPEMLLGKRVTWRQRVNKIINQLVKEGSFPTPNAVREAVYEKMWRIYGFVYQQELKEYRYRYDYIGKVNKFVLIQEKDELMNLFENLLKDLYYNRNEPNRIVCKRK